MKTLTKVMCRMFFIVISALIGGFIGWILAVAAGSIPVKIILVTLVIAALCFYGGIKYERERRLKQLRQQPVKFQKKKAL